MITKPIEPVLEILFDKDIKELSDMLEKEFPRHAIYLNQPYSEGKLDILRVDCVIKNNVLEGFFHAYSFSYTELYKFKNHMKKYEDRIKTEIYKI